MSSTITSTNGQCRADRSERMSPDCCSGKMIQLRWQLKILSAKFARTDDGHARADARGAPLCRKLDAD